MLQLLALIVFVIYKLLNVCQSLVVYTSASAVSLVY